MAIVGQEAQGRVMSPEARWWLLQRSVGDPLPPPHPPKNVGSQAKRIGMTLGISLQSFQIMGSLDTFFRKGSNLEESQQMDHEACISNYSFCALSTITDVPSGNITLSKQSL